MTPGADALGCTAPRFPHRRAGHCGSGALRDLFEYQNLDFGDGALSEGEIFGLGAGLGFLYIEAPSARPPIYLVGRTADFELDIASILGFGVDVCRAADPAEGFDLLRDALKTDGPTMVWADIMHLDYLRVRMHNTRHDIVVVSIDERAEVAYVADNDRDEIQACSLASLSLARCSQAFPGPNENTIFRYAWPDQLPAPRDAVRSAVGAAISNMRGGGRPLAGLEGMTGLSGVKRFAERYARWPETIGDALPEALNALSLFIVKAGTGGAMFRSLYSEFLRNVGERLDSAPMVAAADTYEVLAGAWVELARCAASGDHQSGVALADDIVMLEHSGIEALVDVLDVI